MWILAWIVFSILVGAVAHSKKRSEIGWFFLSLIISPLFAVIILLALGKSEGDLKKCPKCAEQVKAEAQVCRFCGFDFSSSPVVERPRAAPLKKEDDQIKDLASAYINKMTSKKP